MDNKDRLIEKLTAALGRYGKHKMRCVAWGPGGAVDRCTCGLMDRIEEGKKKRLEDD